jgi:hypothetical protein
MEESPISVVKLEVFSPSLNQVCVYKFIIYYAIPSSSVLVAGVAPIGSWTKSKGSFTVTYGTFVCIFDFLNPNPSQ